MTPVLTTSRLTLSAFTMEDAPSVFAYACHPRVAETVTWNAHNSIEDSRDFIEFVMLRASNSPGFQAWALRLSGVAVGSISFSPLSLSLGQIDYALKFEEWGKGLMTEAARAVCEWAFRTHPSLQQIQASCLPTNPGSRMVMQKIGMKFDRMTALEVKGRSVELTTYVLSRSQL